MSQTNGKIILGSGVSSWKQNVGDVERWISMASGAALVLSGLRQGRFTGWIKAATGAAMVYRGLTGQCEVYKALNVDTFHKSRPLPVHEAEVTTLHA